MKDKALENQKSLQLEIISFLKQNPDIWDHNGSLEDGDIQTIETHGATVLLGQEIALKIKKPVLYGHMDYSTPEQRRLFCEKELARNKLGAPALYLDVVPIGEGVDTPFILGENSQAALDFAVRMRRFKAPDQLDQVVDNNKFNTALQDLLADQIADFHKKSSIETDPDKVPDFHSVIDQNFLQLDSFCPELLPLNTVRQYRENLHQRFNDAKSLFTSLIRKKQVRYGHGDLHLQNLCLFEGRPLLFDAIEYQDDFVISDILYDLSFLLMDLWQREETEAANRIFNRYLETTGWLTDPDPFQSLELLPFYLSMRAGIRTHVSASRYYQANSYQEKKRFKARTRFFFDRAATFLDNQPPRLLAIGGFSGSGKSTLARNLSPEFGASPGALRLRSDVIRRKLIDWDDFSPMPQWAYTPEMSQKTYKAIEQAASKALAAGHSVIIDAVLDRQCDQVNFEKIAKLTHVPFDGIWLDVDPEIMAQRIEGRTQDASDATVDILRKQLAKPVTIEENWHRLDGNGTQSDILKKARTLLKLN
ncbi:MAG: AAA family ATPase [Sneathiellales bacterium]|nr:AAA family ATPase [Sneathiellales bacterium]